MASTRFLRFLRSALLLAGAGIPAFAQNASQTAASSDKDVPQPVATGALGQRDASALLLLIDHLKAVGSSPWTGMKGSGTITYGATDQATYDATISILGTTGFRLDGQTANKPFSVRIYGVQGAIQQADGHVSSLLPKTAAMGLFQFELLRDVNFPDAAASFRDLGSTVVGGVSLRRVSYQSAAPGHTGSQRQDITATDLYFDPATHLLLKSANSIRIDGAGNTEFMRVISYDDYRTVAGLQIPFRYTQTLNGQTEWILQLSGIQLAPVTDNSFYKF